MVTETKEMLDAAYESTMWQAQVYHWSKAGNTFEHVQIHTAPNGTVQVWILLRMCAHEAYV